MTESPVPQMSFGMTLAFAERALTASLRDHLAELGTTPETWYALQTIATRGPVMARDAVVGELAQSRRLDERSASELLDRLASEGLIQGSTEVELTAAGAARHRELRESIAVPTAQLLGSFDPADIETTIRTLRAMTERVEKERAEALQAA
jgi:DNA-binding MarR family transcriptional regulator